MYICTGTWKKAEQCGHKLHIQQQNCSYYVNIDGNWSKAEVLNSHTLQSGSKYGVHKWIFLHNDVIIEENSGYKFLFYRNYNN